MSDDDDDLGDYSTAVTIANGLRNGDIDVLVDLMDLLEVGGTKPIVSDLVLGIIWDLLPDLSHQLMIANAVVEGKSNVIDMFTRKPRE